MFVAVIFLVVWNTHGNLRHTQSQTHFGTIFIDSYSQLNLNHIWSCHLWLQTVTQQIHFLLNHIFYQECFLNRISKSCCISMQHFVQTQFHYCSKHSYSSLFQTQLLSSVMMHMGMIMFRWSDCKCYSIKFVGTVQKLLRQDVSYFGNLCFSYFQVKEQSTVALVFLFNLITTWVMMKKISAQLLAQGSQKIYANIQLSTQC